MTIYLDTSAVLRALLGDGEPLPEWGAWKRAYSSELMGVEARRTLDRLRLERVLDDESLADAHDALATTERAIGEVRLTPAILCRAGQPIPTVVKTLDAVHLASALLFAERRDAGLVFGTHDARQAHPRPAHSASRCWACPPEVDPARRMVARDLIFPTQVLGLAGSLRSRDRGGADDAPITHRPLGVRRRPCSLWPLSSSLTVVP